MSAVQSVWAGAEVIDSRYRDFRFRAGDACADNASTGAFTMGAFGLPPERSTSRLALERGWLVLTGGLTDAVPARPGTSVAFHFTNLGSVFVNTGR